MTFKWFAFVLIYFENVTSYILFHSIVNTFNYYEYGRITICL